MPPSALHCPAPPHLAQGVGGDESGRVRVASGTLAWLELGSARFEGVRALLAQSGGAGGGIDLSVYTAGIVCGDLLSRCRVVLDYARSRIAIVPEGQSTSGPSQP
jgi:hypothetical protein